MSNDFLAKIHSPTQTHNPANQIANHAQIASNPAVSTQSII
jgi:hypothetical protein